MPTASLPQEIGGSSSSSRLCRIAKRRPQAFEDGLADGLLVQVVAPFNSQPQFAFLDVHEEAAGLEGLLIAPGGLLSALQPAQAERNSRHAETSC